MWPQRQIVTVQWMVVLIASGFLLVSCTGGEIATSILSTASLSNTSTVASSPTLTPSRTPTDTSTPTPRPTRSPTPTPTWVGGVSGHYILPNDPLILFDEQGREVRTILADFTDDDLCGGLLRAHWSKYRQLAIEYCDPEKQGLAYIVMNEYGHITLDIYTHLHYFGGRSPLITWMPDNKSVAFLLAEKEGAVEKVTIADTKGTIIKQYESCDGPDGAGLLISPDGNNILRTEYSRNCIIDIENDKPQIIPIRMLGSRQYFSDNKTIFVIKDNGSGVMPAPGLMDTETALVTYIPIVKDQFTEGFVTYVYMDSLGPGEDYYLLGLYGYKKFAEFQPNGYSYFLYSVRIDGKHEQKLLALAKYARWSPDGNWVYFEGSPVDDRGNVRESDYFAVKPDGSELQKLIKNGYGIVYGIWMPHSKSEP